MQHEDDHDQMNGLDVQMLRANGHREGDYDAFKTSCTQVLVKPMCACFEQKSSLANTSTNTRLQNVGKRACSPSRLGCTATVGYSTGQIMGHAPIW